MARPIPIGRSRRKTITLSPTQRGTHLHVIGASGKGKSKFLEGMIRQDIINRHGVCLIDPHGTLYDAVVKWCATNRLDRKRRIHLINPSLEGWTIGLNPLRLRDSMEPSTRVDAMVHACAQVWGGEDPSRTPQLKKCLRVVFYALAVQGLTLYEAIELTSSTDPNRVRAYLTNALEDRIIDSVWADLNSMSRREFADHLSSTNNRLVEFLAAPVVRQMLGIVQNAIDLRRCMDEGDIVLVNLARQGVLSQDNARLIGTLITNDLFALALERDERTARAHPFYLYIDECSRYLTDDVEAMLDETRKFGLHVVLSHQRLGQLRNQNETIYNAVMAGAQTKVVFGFEEDEDAELMSRHLFRTEFNLERPKRSLKKPTVVDYVPEWLLSESESDMEMSGSGAVSMSSSGMSEGISEIYDADGHVIGGHAASSGTSSGVTSGGTSFFASGRSQSVGRHQTLRPVLEDRPTQVYTIEELVHEGIVKLRKLPLRTAIMKPPGSKSVQITTPFIKEGYASAKTVEAFTKATLEGSPYAVPRVTAQEEIDARWQRMLERVQEWRVPTVTEDDDKEYLG